jgi:hypothetical protein
MPAEVNNRQPYRRDAQAALARIDGRRRELGVTWQELANVSGVKVLTLFRARKSGLAFKRTITSLQMALRTLAHAKQYETEVFPHGQ